MENYRQYEITTNPFNADLLSGILWELEILGLNENENSLTISVNESSNVDSEKVKTLLYSIVKEHIIESFNLKEVYLENKNWNHEWESKINIIEVTERIVVKPSFREYDPKKDQIVIVIDPKMSFGTGEHQTTRIMLQLLEKFVRKNDSILDVGSGTSLLGIAASKLGSGNIVSVDNDEWCFINGQENAEKNEIKNIKFILGTIDDINEKEFDLVLANINKNVLIEIKEKLFEKVKQKGILILSGIMDTDLEEIKRQFTQIGFTAIEFHKIDEWIGVVLKKS